MDNVELVKNVLTYSSKDSTERTDNDYRPFFEIMSDDITLRYTVPAGTPISGGFKGKEAVTEYFTRTVTEIAENARTEGELGFFGHGDRVVVVGVESYTIKKNRVRCENKDFAMIMDFRDGSVASIVLIKDLTELVDAYRP